MFWNDLFVLVSHFCLRGKQFVLDFVLRISSNALGTAAVVFVSARWLIMDFVIGRSLWFPFSHWFRISYVVPFAVHNCHWVNLQFELFEFRALSTDGAVHGWFVRTLELRSDYCGEVGAPFWLRTLELELTGGNC